METMEITKAKLTAAIEATMRRDFEREEQAKGATSAQPPTRDVQEAAESCSDALWRQLRGD